jgi:hypothetical protein
MEKYTDEQKLAVLKSYVMWSWMAQKGLSYHEKYKYPLYDQLGIGDCICSCPICSECKMNCDDCLMYGRWPGYKKPDVLHHSCYLEISDINKILEKTGLLREEYIEQYDIPGYSKLEWKRMSNKEEIGRIAGDIASALWKLYKEMGG